jgi:hypothetical protein
MVRLLTNSVMPLSQPPVNRICYRCKVKPVEQERVKLLNSYICSTCAHTLEISLGGVNKRPLRTVSASPCPGYMSTYPAEQGEFDLETNPTRSVIKVTTWKRRSKEERRRYEEQKKPLINVIYDE